MSAKKVSLKYWCCDLVYQICTTDEGKGNLVYYMEKCIGAPSKAQNKQKQFTM
jgi:hypothetical protein